MKKALISLSIVCVIALGTPAIPVYAESITKTISSNEQIRTQGLIAQYDMSVYTSKGKLYMNGTTWAFSSMKSIGYKDIVIEYSTNGTDWKTEKTIDDLLKSDSNIYCLNDYCVSVEGGYYYRITCNHYAKEGGLFGKSQSESNTPKSVWIN